MPDKISFALFTGTPNVPLTGATIGPSGIHFTKYVDRDGTPRAPPTISEIGGGEYGFTPSAADEAVGVCYLIDCTQVSGVNTRRFSGAIHLSSRQFICWHVETTGGALWSGTAPTVGIWRDFNGNDRTPPTVVNVGGFGYLFAVTPSDDDLEVDVAYRLDPPAGAGTDYLTGSIEGVAAMVRSTVGASIRALLIADGATAALVGTRIYPNELPQKVQLPAIVYTLISDVPEASFDGDTSTTLKAARLQIDCYARADGSGSAPRGAYEKAHAVAACVERVVGNLAEHDLSANYESARDLYDNVSQYHRVSMDFTVWR